MRQRGFALVDTFFFLKRERRIERGGREASEGICRVSFLQRERLRDAQRFVYSSLEG